MLSRLFTISILTLSSILSFAQGVGIPSKQGGIGFGNLPVFTGIRLNPVDKKVQRINGINVTSWLSKKDSLQTGVSNGIAIGLPMAIGTDHKNGLGLGVFAVGARSNLNGINIGGIAAGAGKHVNGITIAGIGVGSGGDMRGVNIGGIGMGAGANVYGVNVGGVGIGAGAGLYGINVGGIGIGAGTDVKGLNFGGIGIGAGKSVSGISIGGIGIGAGEDAKGLTIGGIGIGAGNSVKGIAIAGVAIGSRNLKALAIAPVVGGRNNKGIFLSAHFQTGERKGRNRDNNEQIEESEPSLKGISLSAVNRIYGEQKGVTIGVFNYATKQRGLQIGLLNYVKDNPRGLRLLPIFNTRFGKRA